jgi:hypothetical protein
MENKWGCACGDDGSDTCKDLSQPGSMAGITSGERGGTVANNSVFTIGSMAGASAWERGNSGSPWWPRAIVQALVERCSASLPAWKKMAARCRGSRGRWRTATTRSGSSFLDGSGLTKTVRSHGLDPPPPAPPLTLLLDGTGGGLGRRNPNWIRLKPRAAAVF